MSLSSSSAVLLSSFVSIIVVRGFDDRAATVVVLATESLLLVSRTVLGVLNVSKSSSLGEVVGIVLNVVASSTKVVAGMTSSGRHDCHSYDFVDVFVLVF